MRNLLEKLETQLVKNSEAQTVLFDEHKKLDKARTECIFDIIAKEKLFAGEWKFNSVHSGGITLVHTKHLYNSPELQALLPLQWDQGSFYTTLGNVHIDDNLIIFTIPEDKFQAAIAKFDIHVTLAPLNKEIKTLEQQLITIKRHRAELLERLEL